jgi:hypothetical protein
MEPKMFLTEGRLLDLMAAEIREGAHAVGIPCRVCFLFSNRGVSVLDIAPDLKSHKIVHEIAGDRGVSGLPFAISLIGPYGVWTKTTQRPIGRLQ